MYILPSTWGLCFCCEWEPAPSPFKSHLCVPPESTSCTDLVSSYDQESTFSFRPDTVDVRSSGGFTGRYGPGNKKSVTSVGDSGETWRANEVREKNAAEVD